MKYLEQEQGKPVFICDVETNDLVSLDRTRWPTKIWCVVCLNLETQDEVIFSDEVLEGQNVGRSLEDFRGWYRRDRPTLIGHNFVSFDAPVLNHLLDVGIEWSDVIDSLLLSQLYDPQMPAPDGLKVTQRHSLEAWGIRLRQLKQDHNEWHVFSREMLERCRSDARLNRSVYLALSKRMLQRGFSELSCYIEHGAHSVIDDQMANGIFFDIPKAKELLECLRTEQNRLTDKIRLTFKPELQQIGEYKYKVRADSKPYASFLRHQAWVDSTPGSQLRWSADQTQYSLWQDTEFNIASPPQRLKRLLELGFIPQKTTKKGNPTVDEESLLEFAKECGIPEVREIAEWLVVFGRANAVENWLSLTNRETSRLHGRVWSCGARNRRMTHTTPNTANIPKVSTKYGRECRTLWRAAPKRLLVGIDAKSLEGRGFANCLATLTGDLETAKFFIDGDPHQSNADILTANPWGYKVERNTGAKNGFFAKIYGAYPKRLGYTFNPKIVSVKDATAFGDWGSKALEKNIPGLADLIADAQEEWRNNNGFIRCIDGGYVRCEDESAALNYRISSSGMILMKLVDIRTRERFLREGLDYKKVLDVHDEDQYECHPDIAQRLGEIGCEEIRNAGEELGFIVPMAGSFTKGENWSLTH